MNLSRELISQFVKITKDDKKIDNGSTVYGTIVEYEGTKCVKLDGSDQITPITSTADVLPGDRVAVLIKNHTATVTGNVTSPSARKETVDEVEKTVNEHGDKLDEFELVVADMVTTEQLNATQANIETLIAKKASVEQLEAERAEIDELLAEKATIKQLEVVDGKFETLDAKFLTADAAELKYATIENLNATNIKVNTLEGTYGKFEDLTTNKFEAIDGDIKNLKAEKANISDLDAANANIENLQADVAEVNELVAKKANITDLNATNANVDNLQADVAEVNELVAKKANITDLNATNAKIDNLDATYAKIVDLNATNANVGNLQADVADIDTLIFGSASGTSIQTSFANAVIAQLGNAQIKSAMIDSVSADKINAGSINTNNVSVVSDDGRLSISDETIQISDDTRVRVQIGKDASNDYSINIWDADGNLMFSKGGITENAVKEAIIRDDMVSDTANISASKLNISSLFKEINDSTETIKSTKIFMDDEKQTLDLAFTQMSSDVNDLSNDVSSQGTQLSVIQGQISSKVWQQDIDTATDELGDEIDTLTTKHSTLEQTVNGISTTVGQHTSQIASKADGSTVTAVNNKVSELETSLDGFKSTVSETYATKTDLSGTQDDVSELTTKQSTLEQTVNGISTTVSQHTSQIASKADGSTVTAVNNKVSELETSLDGFKSTVSETYATKTALSNAEGDIGEISNKQSILEQTIDGLSSTISSHTTQIASKADGSAVTEISNKQSSLEQTVNGLSNTVSSHTTQIASKADNSTVTEISNKQSSLEQTVDSLSSTVSDHTTQIASKADGSTVTTLSTNHSKLEQTVSGLSSTVSGHTTQIASKADGSTVTEISNKQSALEQTVNGLSSTVSGHTTQIASKADGSTVTEVNKKVGKLESSLEGFKSTVSSTYTTKTEAASKGEQLIINGSGLMGDNTNFSTWTFDGAVTNNSAGSFTLARSSKDIPVTDEYFLINPQNEYTISFDAKSLLGTGTLYSMIMFYDVDKNPIEVTNHMHNASSTTTLAKSLSAGDTVIYLTDLSGWSTSYAYGFYLTIWNYTNSFGYTYQPNTYTRNRLTLPKTSSNYLDAAYVNFTNNTITLSSAYGGATIPAGTYVSQGSDGSVYKYCACVNQVVSTNWTTYTGKYDGLDYSGQNIGTAFPPGTAYAKFGFLWNHNNASGEQIWITNVSVTDTTNVSKAKQAADDAQKDVEDLNKTVTTTYATKAELKQSADAITGTIDSLKGDLEEKIGEMTLTDDEFSVKFTNKVNDGGVTKVVTGGHTFDADGLTIDNSNVGTKTRITTDGMTVYRKSDNAELLTATSEGVNATNLHAETYLIVGGRSRFENYGTNRTGCFWIGGS